ncbi:hypothetical protein BDZ45DRAFT_695668 [Acephala macrosclerotiorum]|nr:hypothetical protein BDZ45DRAFT_695668 [Acephala macrosclerotiorum]
MNYKLAAIQRITSIDLLSRESKQLNRNFKMLYLEEDINMRSDYTQEIVSHISNIENFPLFPILNMSHLGEDVDMSLEHAQESTLHINVFDNFRLFVKLPIESRLKIWRATFPKGKLISLDAVLELGINWFSRSPSGGQKVEKLGLIKDYQSLCTSTGKA